MNQKSSDPSHQLKDATAQRSEDHSSLNMSVHTSNNNIQPQTQQMEFVNTEVAACSPFEYAFQYSDKEAVSIMIKLTSDDTFRSGLQSLTSWLKNVEFTETNSTCLFSMINYAQCGVWKLLKEKAEYRDELHNINLDVSQKINNIASQFQEICRVFEERATLQKVWEQFTGPQRKMITTLMQETKQIISDLSKEATEENVEPDQATLAEEYRQCQVEFYVLQNQLKTIQDFTASLRNEENIRREFYKNAMLYLDKCDSMFAEIDKQGKFFQEVESLNKNKDENGIESITSKDFQLEKIRNNVDEEVLKSN